MIYLFLLAGVITGAALFDEEGIFLGLVLGYLSYRVKKSSDIIQDLTTQIKVLKHNIAELASPVAKTPSFKESQQTTDPLPADILKSDKKEEEVAPVAPPVSEPIPDVSAPIQEPEAVFTQPAASTASNKSASGKSSSEKNIFEPGVPAEPDFISNLVTQVQSFIFGGNLFARLGVAVLFIGLSFLIKEAIAHGIFPIELRLAGAFLIGTVMLGLGWRLTKKRPTYGLTLQGGGIAIIYLTVFASFRIFSLIEAQTAFILLTVITLLGVVIALLQNAQSLAVISLLGGFMAPVLASTGSGNHVALFTYYAILNAGVFIMAWYKPWRYLNLTGFFSTFGIATFWGGLSYEPELFSSTEPFLALFFAMYLGISLMYALRHGLEPKQVVDGTLVFGLPVFAFTLQAVLVDPFEYGLAWSALVMGGCYAIVAWIIHRAKPQLLRTLIESLAGVSLALLSMTIPFALDATWTGTGWALEGAALIWLGVKQRRLLVRLSGYALLAFASVSFMYGLEETTYDVFQNYTLIANKAFIGFIVLGLSSLFGAYHLSVHGEKVFRLERWLAPVLLAAGMMWMLAGPFEELRRELTEPHRHHAQLVALGLTMLGAGFVGRKLVWRQLQTASLFLLPLLYAFSLISIFRLDSPFESWGAIAWLVTVGSMYLLLYWYNHTNTGHANTDHQNTGRWYGLAHAAILWFVTLLLTSEASIRIQSIQNIPETWEILPMLAIPALIAAGVTRLSTTGIWPFGELPKTYLRAGVIPILLGLWLISLQISAAASGDPAPLPFIPVLNPLELMLGGALVAGLYWYKTVNRDMPTFISDQGRTMLKWLVTVTAFIWLNASIARAVHHWEGLAYNEALLSSSSFQSAISLCWTLLSLSVMTVSARRGYRIPWMVAAGLLGVVVVKLFLVDLSNLGTIHRVVSFIGVGLLLLLIGYLAPVPPHKDEPAETREGVEL